MHEGDWKETGVCDHYLHDHNYAVMMFMSSLE